MQNDCFICCSVDPSSVVATSIKNVMNHFNATENPNWLCSPREFSILKKVTKFLLYFAFVLLQCNIKTLMKTCLKIFNGYKCVLMEFLRQIIFYFLLFALRCALKEDGISKGNNYRISQEHSFEQNETKNFSTSNSKADRRLTQKTRVANISSREHSNFDKNCTMITWGWTMTKKIERANKLIFIHDRKSEMFLS